MSERTDNFNPPVYTVILHYTSLFSCIFMPNVLITTVIMFRFQNVGELHPALCLNAQRALELALRLVKSRARAANTTHDIL